MAIFDWYLPEKDLGSEAARKSVNFSDQVQIEDLAICEIVQKTYIQGAITADAIA